MIDKSRLNDSPKIPLGSAAAALISGVLGCFAMTVAHQATIQSKTLEEVITNLGSWIPDFIKVAFVSR